MRRKTIILLLALSLVCTCTHASSIAKRKITIDGDIVAGELAPVFAPYGGQIAECKVTEGDLVTGGDAMFTLKLKTVYAPCDGTVSLLGLAAGADASYIASRYGSLISIEPECAITISADTTNAYSDYATKMPRIGEKVYVVGKNTTALNGIGVVTSVNGKAYTIEMQSGNIPPAESVAIFRSENRTASSKLGNGTTARAANVAVTGDGTVLNVHVAQGQKVTKGDALVDLLQGTPNGAVTPYVTATTGGAIYKLAANAGDTVSQGQLLALITNEMLVSVAVPEGDLSQIAEGDGVTCELVGFPGAGMITGVVDSVSGVAVGTGEDTKYNVYVRMNTTYPIRLGMRVSVMFN